MGQAIFTKAFNYTPPKAGISRGIKPSSKPQSFPEHVIKRAVKAGAAQAFEPEEAQKPKSSKQPPK